VTLVTGPEQTDMFGGTTPVHELGLHGHNRALAEAERELDGQLTADEAGAIIHERRGKHHRDTRCPYCGDDGAEALQRLRAKTEPVIGASQHADAPGTPKRGCNHAEAAS